MRIHSFAPIVDKACHTLILGSMPGKTSLRLNQYYGYRYNQFWSIIYDLYAETRENDYEKRCAFLLKHGIALWDVLKSCERQTSLDSDIKTPVVNDFSTFFLEYLHIKRVFFNGQTARKMYDRYVLKQIAQSKILHTLPSTSPAYTLAYAKKLEQWRIVVEY